MINWTRHLSRYRVLAGIAFLPIVGQAQAPSESNLALLVFLMAIGLALVVGVGLAVLMWVLSLRSPYAAVGAAPKAAPKKSEELPEGVHLPSPSIQPLITAIGITITAFGLVFRGLAIPLSDNFNIPIIMVLGLIVAVAGMIGWVREGHKAAAH